MNTDDNDRRDAACRTACNGIATDVLEATHGLSQLYDDLLNQRGALLYALETCRGQWIHSVNADLCIAAIANAKGNFQKAVGADMNGVTITKCVTLCTPEKLSRKELIDQVNYLQDAALKNALTMSEVVGSRNEVSGVAHRLDAMLGALVDSYDAGDQAAILLQIKKIIRATLCAESEGALMAAKTFTVRHGSIRVRVKLLPTIKEVHRAYQSAPGSRARPGKIVHAFFHEAVSAKYVGTVYLPEDGVLSELVPHEVSHALIIAHGGVLPKDDEAYCTAVGIICARIQRRIRLMGVAA